MNEAEMIGMIETVRVLIVDDDSETRDYVSSFVCDEFDVRCSSSLKEALEEIHSFRPHLVVTDLRMPGGNGDELLKILVREFPDILVVLMTGFGDAQVAAQAFKDGIFDFLEKPFGAKEIRILMDNVVQVLSFEEAFKQASAKDTDDKVEALAKDISFKLYSDIGLHLGHIKSCSEAIMLELDKDDIDSDLCSEMSEVIHEQRAIIEDKLSDFYLPECEKQGVVRFEAVVSDAVAIVERKFEDRDVCLIVDVEDSLESVFGQCSQLTKMVIEILDKSLKAAQESSERWVVLIVENVGEFIEVSISDSRDYSVVNYDSRGYPVVRKSSLWSNYVELISTAHGGEVYSISDEAVNGVVVKIRASMDKELIFAA